MRSGSAAVAEENVTIVEIESLDDVSFKCPEGIFCNIFNGLFFYSNVF